MQVFFKSDVGRVRKNNEDSLLAITPWSSLGVKQKASLFIVADGMGGHNAGEIASSIAINTAKEWFESADLELVTKEQLTELCDNANTAVWEYSNQHPQTKGMGTTFTAMLIKKDKAMIAHVGDSRAYRLNENGFKQLTSDHSLIAEQIKNGNITPEEARTHPARHMLSRVMGARAFMKPDIIEVQLNSGDLYLLCSDGVYGMLPDKKILKILQEKDLKKASEHIIDAANDAGGLDNSTVMLLRLDEVPVLEYEKYSFKRAMMFLKNWHIQATG
ncbi:MAG: Stp1/IreP family PP2C-type Ser/Thr phosphatase [Candidatus Riflebacteria bacterium]|nr:Stp1/IreP family PP2C-type Ser/Thr phosphatase [Candidatus Riflebacteria bacterium]